MNSFRTQFGRTIDFLPGYREKYSDQIRAARNALQYDADEICKPASFYASAKDTFEYAMMMDFLSHSGVQLTGVSALDIGGMEATTSRLLKAEGIASLAHCVDIHDYSQQLSIEQFERFLRKLGIVSRLVPRLVRFNFQEHFDFPVCRRSRYHNIRHESRTSADLDGYFSCGFLDMKENFKYEFVSALLCLPYFSLNAFYEKLSAIISDGGYFFFLSDYWWSHNNSTGLIGNFPWCAQRLTEVDFFRYFEAQHKEDIQVARQRYQYYHNNEDHPTISDHIRIAQAHGFNIITCRRYLATANDGERHLVTPSELEQSISLSDVLADIHEFRPDVCEADLRTSFISAVFLKA